MSKITTIKKDAETPKNCDSCKYSDITILEPCDVCDQEYSEWEGVNENADK